MASVTFPTLLGGNGRTYNDLRYDPVNNTGGLDNGGHVLNFVPMLGQSVLMAEQSYNNFLNFKQSFLGNYANDTAANASVPGGVPQQGALYYRTSAPQQVMVYIGTQWRGIATYTTGDLRIQGSVQADTFEHTLLALGNISNTQALDISLFNQFSFTATADLQLSFNYPSPTPNTVTEFKIKFIRQAGIITFPASVRWNNNAAAPTFTANRVQVLSFYTDNGGVSWFGTQQVINAVA